MATSKASSRFLFYGNSLCLDFVNTERMREGARVDLIESADDLWEWMLESGALPLDAVESGKRQLPGEVAVREAKELRAALRGMARQMAAGETVAPEIAEMLNAHLRRRRGYQQLTLGEGGWTRRFHSEDAQGMDFLFTLVDSAIDLLSGGQGLVRQCESNHCILYFFDTTKNHRRRWCCMEGCGNRHKAAEHYRRRKAKDSRHETLDEKTPL
ncbi:hypothetical protein CCAX7_53430 [Capsulimonas corticalis]|uniref:Uncharacterized protein n=1 Tax=Capsulimonas corticalis TaxID=2219043 RepID=A0A402CNV4_9BACT|nr:ABATE domain-containing protein [Capsulimonas corticalis]BDI33292.1 hypothetical protein CCAX7_53430 [Capsulimonas corticalis]